MNNGETYKIKPWAFFPDLRFDLSNGRTLCRDCHNKTKIGAKRMRENYKKVAPHLATENQFDPRPFEDDDDNNEDDKL